jgi:hypothetical protein
MSPRERVLAALRFRKPDVVPLEYHSSPSGFYEHGERLRELWARRPDDFGPAGRFQLCAPAPECVDGEGRYSEIRRDEWGVVRQHLIFGATGLSIERPLDEWSALSDFRTPPVPASAGPAFYSERARASRHRESYFLKSGWISLFELTHSLRRFEDVLMDIASDAPEINRLADTLVEHHAASIRYLIARGVDAIQFGDDFGTQCDLMLSPKTWRTFFKPRYAALTGIARESGCKVFFHTCGRVLRLFDDLADLGVDAIWPRLNAYDERDLAAWCRGAKIAPALHPDRGGLMINSAPDDVRRYVERLAKRFAVDCGGAWFYVEVDAGFPYENVAALTESIARLRGMGSGR